MSIFWWIWFDRKRRSDEDKKILIVGIALSFVSLLIARGLALLLPFRQRPLRNPALNFQIPFTLNPNVLIGWSSLPSDHATLYFCLAIVLFFISRKLGLAALLYTCIVVCFPRLYLGIHYPTDILAGAVLGIAIGSTVGIRKIRQTVADPFIHWMETSPQSFYPVLFFCTFCVAQQFDGVREMGKFTFDLAKFVAHHHHKIG